MNKKVLGFVFIECPVAFITIVGVCYGFMALFPILWQVLYSFSFSTIDWQDARALGAVGGIVGFVLWGFAAVNIGIENFAKDDEDVN